MVAVTDGEVKDRLIKVLKKLNLPTEYKTDLSEEFSYLSHDKKCTDKGVSVVLCPKIGAYEIKDMTLDEFKKTVLNSLK